ncbi:RHS repeat-associated core domain-containing protein [Neisseria zalophi]|uniref:RHS protein conserved region domain-containing protein n=1 Tax=Neisseria zalophi TaxID=640030 RepID=A0A5J6PUA1_9NEIS|nr:RHS repeat-associated core domain-containing protein [Neisseria zalophi]QEY26239.1 hypothetical protein D0T92_06690 [Neisseria zalophi]
MGRLKHQTATANPTLQNNSKLNTLVGGAVRRSYRYDKAGNLIQTADQRSGVLDYVYDKIGRIKTAGKEHFAFDPANNILSDGLKEQTTKGRLKGDNIGLGNRIETYNGTEYTYDPLGNLIYRQLPNGENQFFRYDTENQLVLAEIKKNNGETQTWAYAYDPFGRRLSKERTDKGALQSTHPKRTHFVWNGSRLLQEYNYKGNYTYVYTDQDSYEPLAQVFYNNKDEQQYLAYFHNDQIGIPREMTDQFGNLLWYGEYTAWGKLNKDERVYPLVHQPFRLQNQYYDEETGLHYNLMRYYEPDSGRFVNQDPIGLDGGSNLYSFALNATSWVDPSGLAAFALPMIAPELIALGKAALALIGIGATASLAHEAGKKVGSVTATSSNIEPPCPEGGKCKNEKDREKERKRRNCDALFDTYEQALNAALEFSGISTKNSKPNPTKFGSMPYNGRRHITESRGFRVEYDNKHNAHINAFNKKNKKTYCFNASKKTVNKILKRFN